MELRKQIIKAAAELFKTEGLQFTMQEVATALHISKKTIYTVYTSKEDLLLDMVDDLFADIHHVKSELAASSDTIEERIKAVIVALPEQYAAMDFRMLDSLDEKYPAAARRVREHLETNWEPTIALIEEGIAAGRIRPVPIPVLKQMIIASIESFLMGDNNDGGYADTLGIMIDIIMNGIRRRENEV
ncbi:MAG: TetR/AcrR family transcriptional regulator [Oscillospiraceae bacterium]|nr:TetR/AcrR family transcriptional regulator [Oscillospiraceae bacterium]